MLKFPYGTSDFYSLITENYFYVDRTAAIPQLENVGKQLLFLRPPRFGKSLLLSMLQNYYDVAKAGEFDRLFGHLAIGKQPTPKHNQYWVLKWDFSNVSTAGGVHHIQQALYDHINGCIEQFVAHYKNWLDYEITIDPNNAIRSFHSVLAAVSQTPYRLYLLIDEYDNFANDLMMTFPKSTVNRQDALFVGETALKFVFKAVKSAGTGGSLDRVFITGVSPVILTDLTSGYNVVENIYLRREFHDLCGFTETEIATVLTQLGEECQWPMEQVTEELATMKQFYNGYRFSEDGQEPIYNPTLAWYFLKTVQRDCRPPVKMLDSNLAPDRRKLTYLSHLPHGESILLTALGEHPPVTIPELADRFGIDELLKTSHDTSWMVSLFYYLGILTLAGRDEFGGITLSIPNLVIRKLYVEQLIDCFLPEMTEEVSQLAQAFYRTGDLQPVCEFVEQRYFKVLDNRDSVTANELTLKVAFLTLLFNDRLYVMDSETALERGYADLTMIVRPQMRQYRVGDFLFEFKRLSLAQATLPNEEKLTAERVKQLTSEELKIRCQVPLAVAREQLQRYRQTLLETYGEILRLKVFAVVAVGWERIIWEEI